MTLKVFSLVLFALVIGKLLFLFFIFYIKYIYLLLFIKMLLVFKVKRFTKKDMEQ